MRFLIGLFVCSKFMLQNKKIPLFTLFVFFFDEIFVNYPHSFHFWQKIKKKVFFKDFKDILKNVAQAIFDQRICWVINWVFFSTNTPFFVLFFENFFTESFSHFLMTYFFPFPFLTKNSETILQMAILGEKQKNFFFLKTLS